MGAGLLLTAFTTLTTQGSQTDLKEAMVLKIDKELPAWPYGTQRGHQDTLDQDKRMERSNSENDAYHREYKMLKNNHHRQLQAIDNYLDRPITLLMTAQYNEEGGSVYQKVEVPAHTKALIVNPLYVFTITAVYEVINKEIKELYVDNNNPSIAWHGGAYNVSIRVSPLAKNRSNVTGDTISINLESDQSHGSVSTSTSSAH